MGTLGRLFCPRVFTVVFGVGYVVAVYGNYPLFRYYPMVTQFSLEDLTDRTLGPGIFWYGWIAMAAVPAVLAAVLIPKRIGARIPAVVFWIVPVVMFLAGWYREQEWFR